MTNPPINSKTSHSGSAPDAIDAGAALASSLDLADPVAASVQAMRTSIIITDPREIDNPIVFANDAFHRLTGYSSAEILGRNCRFLQGPDTDPAAVVKISTSLEAAQSIVIEILNYRKDGQPFWNRLAIAPVYDATGTLAYFFANQIDVTHERLTANLQHDDRTTSAIAESPVAWTSDLVQAGQQPQAEVDEPLRIEAASDPTPTIEAIEPSAGFTHEFCGLLEGFVARLASRQGCAASHRTTNPTGNVTTATQAAASPTEPLPRAALRQSPRPQRVDANRVLAGMDELLEHTLGRSIEIEMSLARGLLPSLCDPNLLEIGILRLAINARHTMPRGGRFTIATANTFVDESRAPSDVSGPTHGQYTAVSVTYSGTGMTPGMLARGFEPLFATRPAEQDGESSVSMVRGFSQHFQGQVCIRSKPRRGTTVKLYLPNYRDPAAADVGAASMPGVEAPPTRAAARVPEPNFAKRAQAKTSAPQHTTAGYG